MNKYIPRYIALCAFALMLSASMSILADQRMETEQGLCHFSYDVNDDDNEVYYGACANTIDTYDAGDGQGRLAYSKATKRQDYLERKGTYPAFVDEMTFNERADGKLGSVAFRLKGDGNTAVGGAYTVQPNVDCVTVTSNFNAGNNANNYTEYTTRDWELEAIVQPRVDNDGSGIPDVIAISYSLNCRNGAAN